MIRGLIWGAGLVILALVGGFLLFLADVHASTDAKPERADVIVALSGDPRRSQAAVKLLKAGFGKQLIIVGHDNQEEVALLGAANPSLFQCCVKVDHSSLNTVQDVRLVRQLMPEHSAKSVLLVTSSFHMPRARNELGRALPDTRIIVHGISDDFYQPERVLSDYDVASAFVRQYLMYLGSWFPHDAAPTGGLEAERALRFFSNLNNLAAIAVTFITALFVIFAISRHRRRRLEQPSHLRSRSGSRSGR